VNARIIRIVEEVGRSPGGEEVVGHRNSDRAGAKGHVEIVFVRPTIVDGPSARFSGAFTTPITEFEEDCFTDGLGFDGPSVRGWQAINESDMLVMPDPSTAVMDPFTEVPTLSLICDIVDPITREDYGRDPRAVSKRADAYLKSTGIADTVFFGAEAEFFVFDNIQCDQNQHSGYYFIDSQEGRWNSGAAEEPVNLGYKPPFKGGYFPVPPHDSMHDIRSEMVQTMIDAGLETEPITTKSVLVVSRRSMSASAPWFCAATA